MKNTIHKIGAGQSLIRDYKSLLNFLTSNYDTKNEWRMTQGLMDGGFPIIDEVRQKKESNKISVGQQTRSQFF